MTVPLLYLGKPGDMRPLPIPDAGWAVEDKRYSALTRSLNGTGTETLFGIKKSYSFDLPGCSPEDRAWLDLCWSGAVRPLTFIDPLQPNRFPVTVASTGGTVRGAKDFTSTGGSLVVAAEPSVSPYSVKLSSGTAITYSELIVLPGETVTVTSRVHASATVTPKLTAYDSTGSQLATETGEAVPAGSAFAVSTMTFTVPAGTAKVAYSLTTSANADITTNGWLATVNGSTRWTAGGGVTKVAMTDLTAVSPVYPYSTVSVALEQL